MFYRFVVDVGRQVKFFPADGNELECHEADFFCSPSMAVYGCDGNLESVTRFYKTVYFPP